MSEQDKRAEGMPQRWKLERGPDGAWNTAQMTTTEDGEWCKADDVAAALAQARREGDSAGYRRGVEALRDWLKCKDAGAGVASYNAWIEREAARLLSKGRTDG